MAYEENGAVQNAALKIGLLANLFAQPGDLVLVEDDKAGLVQLFEELINDLKLKERDQTK